MRYLFNLILLALFLSLIGVNQGYSLDLNFRKYAGEFMDIGVAPRAQGMGGAFTTISGDVSCSYYNPAGLIDVKNTQIAFMHTQQMIVSVNYDYLAFAHRQGENRTFALSLIRLGVDNIADSRQAQVWVENDWHIDYNKVKNFNYADYIFTLSVAQRWKHGWVFGGNVKIIRRDLAEFNANGIGLDFGMRRNFFRNLTLAADVRNVTTTLIAWNTGEKELVKPALYLGSSYFLSLKSMHSTFRPAVDLILRGENRSGTARGNIGIFSADIAGGLEYGFRNALFLRAGIDEISRFNVGAGVNLPHLRIDYSFTNYDNELGNSHRVGLIVSL